MERKQKLIEALEAERVRFMKRSQDTTEHDIAIQYLKTGSTTSSSEEWELLDAAINDFETLCNDYNC